MIIKADFLNHWKTKLLIKRLGDGAALTALISLWAYCEQRRAWQFRLSPLELAGVCDYGGEPQALFDALTELRFIQPVEEGEWIVNGWGEMNQALVCKWPGRKLLDGEFYHPKGFISPPIPRPIAQPIGSALPQPIPGARGEDRIGKELPPKAPQGGQDTDVAGAQVDPPASAQPALTPKKKKGGAARASSRLAEPTFPDDLPHGYHGPLSEWFRYKQQIGKGYVADGWAKLITMQRRFTVAQVTASVETSMANNWAGLFTDRLAAEGAKNGSAAPADQPLQVVQRPLLVPPDGYERALEALYGPQWADFLPAWPQLDATDRAKVKAWLAQNPHAPAQA